MSNRMDLLSGYLRQDKKDIELIMFHCPLYPAGLLQSGNPATLVTGDSLPCCACGCLKAVKKFISILDDGPGNTALEDMYNKAALS